MQPVSEIIEPAKLAQTATDLAIQWDEDGLTRFINRIMRRWHEKCLNFDRKTGQRRKKKKKSPVVQGRSEVPGAFRIPFATPLFLKIMDYVQTNGPGPGTIQRHNQNQAPF
jgi:hypothetical protein